MMPFIKRKSRIPFSPALKGRNLCHLPHVAKGPIELELHPATPEACKPRTQDFHPTYVFRDACSGYAASATEGFTQVQVATGHLNCIKMDWLLITGVASISLLTLLIWRRYFSAISDIPGPFAASFTRLWHMHRILKGDQNLEIIRLHEQHGKPFRPARKIGIDSLFTRLLGHFVRISYDEVSVSHPEAIAKILVAPLHKVRYR
jgi:hypothetical protein